MNKFWWPIDQKRKTCIKYVIYLKLLCGLPERETPGKREVWHKEEEIIILNFVYDI